VAEPASAIAARAAIADLVYGYARCIRTGDGAAAAALFADDALFEVRALAEGVRGAATLRGRFEGRAALERYLVQGDAAQASVCPLIHNLMIELDGATASAHSVMTTLVWPSGKQIVGEYQDRFRRDGERWCFTERIFTIFGPFA